MFVMPLSMNKSDISVIYWKSIPVRKLNQHTRVSVVMRNRINAVAMNINLFIYSIFWMASISQESNILDCEQEEECDEVDKQED